MKRIETLTPNDRLAIVRTLNAAGINGKSAYICPGRCVECMDCAGEAECDTAYFDDSDGIKSFVEWLNWLRDEVENPAIVSGLRVICTNVLNHYCVERADDLNFNQIYAQGRPFTALFFDQQWFPDLTVIDVFASRYGVACILVKDTRTGENWIYLDKSI